MVETLQNNNFNLYDPFIKLVMFICVTVVCALLLYKDSNNQLGIITFSSLVSFAIGITINPNKINDR